MSFDWKDEAFRKLVSMLIHDDEAYSKLQEMADEIERLQAKVERLLELHRRNLNDVRAWGDLASHHCDWRVRAEGMAERSRAATEQVEKDE